MSTEFADARLTTALYQISALASRADDPNDAMQSVLKIISDYFNAASGTISLLNPDTGKLEIEVHRGMPANIDSVALRLGQGITGWVAFHGRAQLVPDVSADPRYVTVRPEVRCEMTTPLVQANGQVLGIINLDSDELAAFNPTHLNQFGRLAEEASAVLQRVWQLRHLQGKAHQLENLVTTGQAFVTKLEPQELHDTITRDSQKILGCRECALYLVDSASRTVRLESFTGPSSLAPLDTDLPLEACLVAAVLHTRRAIEFFNIQSPEYIDVIDLPRDPSLRSLLAVPMLVDDEVVGVLAAFTDQPHRYDNDEKRLLTAIASLAAVTLQNSRLYSRVFESEETLRKNEQLITLGLLAAEIAHEIRNPLTVLKLLFGHLDLEFADGDPRRTDVRVIGEKIDQLEAIVSRVLHFSKVPSSLHTRWNLSDIISDTILLVRLKLAQGKIQLHYTPPPHPVFVEGHKGQLQQVLLNLLLNATQAMPAGGDITLDLALSEPGSSRWANLDISDSGPGIPPEMQGLIFDSFLSGRPDGTGLGLSIAKRILLSHHGNILLQSSSAAGTTIRMRLPLVD